MTLFPSWNCHLSSRIPLKLRVPPTIAHWDQPLPSRGQTHRCLHIGETGHTHHRTGGWQLPSVQHFTCSWYNTHPTWQLLSMNNKNKTSLKFFKGWGYTRVVEYAFGTNEAKFNFYHHIQTQRQNTNVWIYVAQLSSQIWGTETPGLEHLEAWSSACTSCH